MNPRWAAVIMVAIIAAAPAPPPLFPPLPETAPTERAQGAP